MDSRAMSAAGVLLSALFASGGVAEAASVTFALDPRATYLRANNETPPNPLAIDLALVGATSGSTLLLEVFGDYLQAPTAAPVAGTLGVFSSSNTLLAATNLNRVTGAIDAGVDFTTGATFFPRPSGVATDIPQDFLIGPSLQIVVPENARYLFASAVDSFYTDNTDADRNYALRITTVATAPVVPLPASVWAGLGLAGLIATQRFLRTRRTTKR